ncbi:MAG: PAS domain-containing protein [Thermaurantimonas sp.]
MESIPQLIIQIDRDYNIISFNNRFTAIVKALFDKNIEEGESIFEFTFDEDIDRVKKAIDLAFNGQQTITEKKVVLKNGNDFWIRLHYLPVEVQNTIQSIIIIISDQTEYKNLLINTNRLAAIAEESPIPIFEINYNGIILYANHVFIQEFGINKGQYIPHAWMDFAINVFDDVSTETELKYQNKIYKFYGKKNPLGEIIRIYILDISLIAEKNRELEKQKEFYESIMNVIPSDVVVFDKDLRYTFVNKYAVKDEQRRKWIIGKTDEEYFELRNLSKEVLKIRENRKLTAIESKQQIEWTEEFIENGEKKYYLRRIKPFYNGEDTLEFLLGYGTDITSQKKAELELEKQKKLYKEILNNLPVSVFLKSIQGTYIFANAKTLKYIGITESDFVGKTDYEIYPKRLAEEYRKTDKIVFEKGEYLFEDKLDTPWGIEYIYGGKRIIKIDNDEHLILGYSLDVTEKIHSQIELRKQTELNKKILDISPTLIYIKKSDGTICMANKATARLFGYDDPSDIIDKKPENLGANQEELLIWRLNDKKVLDSNELHIFEETYTDNNGATYWYLTHKIPFYLDGERCILGIGVDITQIKNIQSKLIELNHEVQKASEAKSKFLSNMSHEIRTPLNAIIGFSELMMQEPLDEKTLEFTQTILFSAKNLLNLINDILDFSKLQQGKFPVNFIVFELNDFISSIESIFKLKAKEKNIYFKIEKDFEKDILVETDQTLVHQILNNLLSNAIKFTKFGGVRMKVSISNDDTLIIEIHDTGIGISDQFKERIFNSFEQENSNISREFGGTGLGLSITRSFVQLLKGTIHFESTKDVGTIFYVNIPVRIHKIKYTETTPNIQTGPSKNNEIFYSESHKNFNILIAEDNPVNQRLMITILNRFGFALEVANNGVEVLQKVAEKHYDLILMDLHMPEMDGFKAAELIRASSGFPTEHSVPMAAVTADVLPETLEKCNSIGFNAFIKKPMDMNHLLTLLKKLVSGELHKS